MGKCRGGKCWICAAMELAKVNGAAMFDVVGEEHFGIGDFVVVELGAKPLVYVPESLSLLLLQEFGHPGDHVLFSAWAPGHEFNVRVHKSFIGDRWRGTWAQSTPKRSKVRE